MSSPLPAPTGLGAALAGSRRPVSTPARPPAPPGGGVPARGAGAAGAVLTGTCSSRWAPAGRSRRWAGARATAEEPSGPGEDEPSPGRDGAGAGAGGGDSDIEKARSRLMSSWSDAPAPMSGQELWDMVKDKFGASFDVRLVRRGKQMYLHVMWKYLEMKSFPLTPDEYLMQLDAVCEYLNAWGCQDRVRQEILSATKGPGIGPGGGRAMQVRLDVDFGDNGEGRSNEWF